MVGGKLRIFFLVTGERKQNRNKKTKTEERKEKS